MEGAALETRPQAALELWSADMTSHGRIAAYASGVALVGIAIILLTLRFDPDDTGLDLSATGQPVAEGFAGSAACADCHADQVELWAGSTHGRAGGPPSPETVVAPFDGTPIAFDGATVTPRVEDSGAYVFVVDRPDRPTERFTVDGVVGRGHMLGGGTQGFLTEMEDGTVRFLPFDFSVTDGTWFCNTAPVAGWWISGGGLASIRPDDGWIPISPTMQLTDCGDWPPVRVLGTDDRFANCQSCHGSQIELAYDGDAGRYETTYTTLAINCESCHGPAADHVDAARAGFPGGDPGIGSLAVLDKEASVGVCLQCHAIKRRLEPGYLPGRPLQDHFSLKAPLVGDRPYLPDGRVRTFAYQQNHLSSACFYAGSMTCVDCHEPHGQGYRDQTGQPLASPTDDGQCVGCHASKAEDPERHTFHAPESEGARCVSCHMPYLQQPVLGDRVTYGRSDHTISVPRPLLDEQYGLEGACAQCHTDRSPARLAADIDGWWGETKPLGPLVAALVAAEAAAGPMGTAGALTLLRPDDAEPMTQMAALNHLFDAYFQPATVPPESVLDRLRALAAAEDVDVAATALAALNLTAGDDLFVRAFLDDALRAPEPRASRLRSRWALTLTLVADQFRRKGDLAAYLASLEAAVTVTPTDSEALLNLAAAYAETGRSEEAIQHYIRSIQLDEGNSVALVNLGLLLESLGREAEAEPIYRQAIEARPIESLARMNLGNVHLRRSEFTQAAAEYAEAVRFTPGMPLAHFYKAIAHVQLGELDAAREALRSASEFAPDDPQIRSLLEQIDTLGAR